MLSDVVLEHRRADYIFADAILRKRQKSSLLPPAGKCGPGCTPNEGLIVTL